MSQAKCTEENAKKEYDLVLFGVTGFTGKLALEHLWKTYSLSHVRWAVSARNRSRAETVLNDICISDTEDKDLSVQKRKPPLIIADLLCETSDQVETLRRIVEKTKVVLTCSGPFERYGPKLVKLCAESGVHYADITGETDFVRAMILAHDKKARETGALIISHCGNDCIPQDLTVYEMHRYSHQKGARLIKAECFSEFPPSASMSGGTVSTAQYQLGKNRASKLKPDFDPLLTNAFGKKSMKTTKNISPKGSVTKPDVGSVEPWIMGPVMVNCIRRSNALLGYNEEFHYGDARVSSKSLSSWLNEKKDTLLFASSMLAPSLFGNFLPSPGEGPLREDMENGYLILHGQGVMQKSSTEDGKGCYQKDTKLYTKFTFNKDIGYLYTAALLVETGMMLLEDKKSLNPSVGGCVTPAVAFGSDLTQRILSKLDARWELKEVEE